MKPAILIVTTLVLQAVWCGGFPLGVPGEWTWSRLTTPSPLVWSLVLPIVVAAIFTGFVWLGAKRIDGASRWETVAWLAGLVVAGVAWLFTVQDAAPSPHNLSKVAWVLYYPGPSGYFTEAKAMSPLAPEGGEAAGVRGEADVGIGHKGRGYGTERGFLRDYESKMSRGDVLHIGTHPPGLIVGYRGLMRLCDASPALVNLLHTTMLDSVREMLDVIAEQEQLRSPAPLPNGGEGLGVRGPPRSKPPFTRRDAAVLWLAGLVVHFLAALTIVPLFCLVRRTHSARSAWLAASLWPTVPALAVFLPKSDAMLPFFAISFLALWQSAWTIHPHSIENRKSKIENVLSFLLAGFILWLGLFISLGMLPAVFLAAVLTMWEGWLCRPEDRIEQPARRLLVALACAAVGFLIPIAMLYFTTGMNLFAVWSWNLHNHSGFYSQYSRTYWKWLLVNPIELTIAAGVPLVVLAITANGGSRAEWRRRACGPVWACLTTWLALWLSGKNMGEAARLWIIIMPWFVWLAARAFDNEVECAAHSRSHQSALTHPPLLWLVVLILQFVVTLSIVLNVGGFDVPAVR